MADSRVPHLHRLIEAAGDQAPAVGTEVHGSHALGMALEDEQSLAGPDIPYLHVAYLCMSSTGQSQPLAVGAETDFRAGLLQGENILSGAGIQERGYLAADGEVLPVG